MNVEALHREMRELGYTTNSQTSELIDLFIKHLRESLRSRALALVPVEPTRAMIEAAGATPGATAIDGILQLHSARTGWSGDDRMGTEPDDSTAAQMYRAMLATAPKPGEQA